MPKQRRSRLQSDPENKNPVPTVSPSKEIVLPEVLKTCSLDKLKTTLFAAIVQDTDFDPSKELRLLRDTDSSKAFVMNRLIRKGVDLETMLFFIEEESLAEEISNSMPVPAYQDTKHHVARAGTAVSVSDRTKGIESFQRAIRLKMQLDPNKVHRSRFRQQARDLESRVLQHASLMKLGLEFGYLYFVSCFTSKTQERFLNFVDAHCASETYEAKISKGIDFLAGDDSEALKKRARRADFDHLKKKRYSFVSQLHLQYSNLLRWHPDIILSDADQIIEFQELLCLLPYGTQLELSGLNDRHANLEELVAALKKREEIIRKSSPFKANMGNFNPKYSKLNPKQLNGRKQLCKNFSRNGNCKFADKCKFLHVPKGSCIDFALGKCKRQNCKYKHENTDTNLTANMSQTSNEEYSNSQTQELKLDSEGLQNDVIEFQCLQASLRPITDIKPYVANPSLRKRQQIRLFMDCDHGYIDTLALLDDGSQPTIIHESLYEKFKKAGVPMLQRQFYASVSGLSTSKRSVTAEIEFEAKIKKKNVKMGFVVIRVYAIVVSGTVNHNCLLGADMRNLYCINSNKNPDFTKREVTIAGIPVPWYPCNVKDSINLIDLSYDVGSRPSSNIQVAVVDDLGFVENADQILEADDSRLRSLEKRPMNLLAIPTDKAMAQISQLTNIPRTLAEKPNLQSEAAVQMLERIQQDMLGGKLLINHSDQFYLIKKLVCRFADRFVHELPEIGGLKIKPHSLDDWYLPSFKPIKMRPYRLAPDRAKAMDQKLLSMTKLGYVEKIADKDIQALRWTSAAFPVWDKCKAIPRIVVHYKFINDAIKLMYEYIPIDESSLHRVIQAPWVISSDAKRGFPQCPATEQSQLDLSFITSSGIYCSKGLPFGYKNSNQVFCGAMRQITQPCADTVSKVDDCFNLGSSFETCVLEWAKMLARAESFNLYFSAKKFQPFPRELSIMGLLKVGDKYLPDPKRFYPIDSIRRPKPGNQFVKQIRRIIGLFIYYLRFLPNFWVKMSPIKKLTLKNAKPDWNAECQLALDWAKAELKKATLWVPKFDQISIESPFIIDADSSNVAGGGTIAQLIDGKERLLSCVSFAYTEVQQRYPTIRQELLNGLRVIDQTAFIHAGFPILLRLDAKTAIHFARHPTQKLSEPYTRLAAGYDSYPITDIKYRAGKLHTNADFVSRPFDAESKSRDEARTLAALFPKHLEAAASFMATVPPEINSVELDIVRNEGFEIDTADLSPVSLFSSISPDIIDSPTYEYELKIVSLEVSAAEFEFKSELLSDIGDLQRDEYPKIFDAIENEQDKNHLLIKSKYQIVDGKLYKISAFEIGDDIPLLLVVPKDHRNEVLEAYHVDNLCNHRNARDLAAKILRCYYWENLERDARKFVAQCQVCIRTKTGLKQLPYLQHSLPSVPGKVSIDAIGPIEGNRHHYLLSMCIMSIGYVFGKTYKQVTSKEFADLLLEFIYLFGVPPALVCDQGSSFIGKVAQHLRNRLRFKSLVISAKNKRANSIQERSNRTFNNGALAQLLQNVDEPMNWDLYAPAIIFSMNTMKNKYGKIPAELLFGFVPALAPDLDAKRIRDRTNVNQSVDDRLQKIKTSRLLYATLVEEKKLFKNFRRNSHVSTAQDYQVGDLVWVWRDENLTGHRVSRKYDVKKVGPMTIVAKSPYSDVYRVVDLKTGYDNKVHSRCLSPYGTFRPLPDTNPVVDEEVEIEVDDDNDEDDDVDDDDNNDDNVDDNEYHDVHPILPIPPAIDKDGKLIDAGLRG